MSAESHGFKNLSGLGVPYGSPERVAIPDSAILDGTSLDIAVATYHSTGVQEESALQRWSDPMDFEEILALGGLPNRSIAFPDLTQNANGIFPNPYQNTGLDGKLFNGKWSANQCVDIAATRRSKSGIVEVAIGQRRPDSYYIFPGGHLNIRPMESLEEFLRRSSIEEDGRAELEEEMKMQMGEKIVQVATGIFLFSPNTSNSSWRETTLLHHHMEGDLADQVPEASDDLEDGNAFWININEIEAHLSPSHNYLYQILRKHLNN